MADSGNAFPRKSSLLHDGRERSLAAAVNAIREAEGWLASWCPHGMDSSRTADYDAADEARQHLEAAKLALEMRSA